MTSCRLHWLWFVLDLCREEDTPLLYTIISLRPERASMTHSSFLFSTKKEKLLQQPGRASQPISCQNQLATMLTTIVKPSVH